MRKLAALVALILATSIIGTYPASSAVNCGKLKTQVLSLEKKVEAEFRYFYNLTGSRVVGAIEAKYVSSKVNKNVQKLGKLYYNNPKCFTRSQKDQILKGRYWLRDTIATVMTFSSGYGKECKGNPTKSTFVLSGKKVTRCDIPPYMVLAMSPDGYQGSIYNF